MNILLKILKIIRHFNCLKCCFLSALIVNLKYYSLLLLVELWISYGIFTHINNVSFFKICSLFLDKTIT